MSRLGFSLLLLALGAAAAAPPAGAASAKSTAAAAAAGAIAGVAVGAAISGSTLPPQIIVNNYGPRRPGGWAAYSPKPGFTCYPRQQACYRANGAYAANLTWTEFRR